MSTLSDWSYTNVATVWPSTFDQYGQPSFGTPYTIACTWADTGDTQTDDAGNQFVPESTFWFESEYAGADYGSYLLSDGSLYLTTDSDEYLVNQGVIVVPERGDYIAKFDKSAQSDPIAAGAQKIKKVTSYDMSPFGSTEIPDWEVFT